MISMYQEKDIVRDSAPCPTCQERAKKHSVGHRVILTLRGRLGISYGKFFCPVCEVHFSESGLDMYAPRAGKYGWDVIVEVYRLHNAGATYKEIHEYFLELGIPVPKSTAHDMITARRYK